MKQVKMLVCLFSVFGFFAKPFALTEEEKAPPPGALVPVYDPYERDKFESNPMYFAGLPEKPWLYPEAEYRFPALVTEPVGMYRVAAPVSVIHEFPQGTSPDSIRVATPYGKELLSQVNVIDKEKNSIEVLFVLAVKGGGSEPVFIYYGREPVASRKWGGWPEFDEPAVGAMALEETEWSIKISNERFFVEFNRVPDTDGMPLFRALRPHGARHSQVALYSGRGPGGRAEVVEAGPVRKTVAYKTQDGSVNAWFSVYAGLPLLFYSHPPGRYYYLPGGDTQNDDLWYETDEGLRRASVSYGGGNTPLVRHDMSGHVKESWMILHDHSRHEMIGEFFNHSPSRCRSMSFAGGISLMGTAGRGAMGAGAIFCDREHDIENARSHYIAWKNPVLTIKGEPHARHDIQPEKPVFGRDFVLMHLLNRRYAGIDPLLWINDIIAGGGNALLYWRWQTDHRNERLDGQDKVFGGYILQELAELCKKHGVMLATGSNVHRMEEQDIASLAKLVDGIWLADEWGWRAPGADSPEYEALNNDFKKRYGMDLPKRLLGRPANAELDLTVEEEYNFYEFMMDKTTEIKRGYSKAARAADPDVFITHTTSPNNIRIANRGYHDLENMADDVTTLIPDLYTTDPWAIQSVMLQVRGAMGNLRPTLVISGYCGWDDRPRVELNQYLQLMYGANGLAYFIFDRPASPMSTLGSVDAYRFIDYTGLGSRLAGMRPMEFIGIFRDRNEQIAALKRGAYRWFRDTTYSDLTDAYAQAMRPMPVNYIYGSYCKADLMQDYKVLVVPENLSLTDEYARELGEFAAGGGTLLVEGETIRNNLMAGLLGVKRLSGEPVPRTGIKGVAGAAEGVDIGVAYNLIPVEPAAAAQVIAQTPEGDPLITRMEHGDGVVMYIATGFGAVMQRSPEVAGFVRELVRAETGYQPVTMEPASGVWTTVLHDGTNIIVTAFNRMARPVEFDMRLDFPGIERIDGVLSYRNGTLHKTENDTVQGLSLRGLEVDFYLVTSGKAEDFVPASSPAAYDNASYRAIETGMDFLKIEATTGRRRVKDPNVIYVGVFKVLKENLHPCEVGAEAIFGVLDELPGVSAEYIHDLESHVISFYDVLVVPNIYYGTGQYMVDNWEANVRQYVENGGNVLLIHHSVGYRDSSQAPLLFPEIGEGVDFRRDIQFRAVADHPLVTAEAFHDKFRHDLENPAFSHIYREPVMSVGDEWESGFPDFIVMTPGPESKTIVESVPADGSPSMPAVLTGEIGDGRVVLCGMGIGSYRFEVPGETDSRGRPRVKFLEKVTQGEKNILINSIYWLGAKER